MRHQFFFGIMCHKRDVHHYHPFIGKLSENHSNTFIVTYYTNIFNDYFLDFSRKSIKINKIYFNKYGFNKMFCPCKRPAIRA